MESEVKKALTFGLITFLPAMGLGMLLNKSGGPPEYVLSVGAVVGLVVSICGTIGFFASEKYKAKTPKLYRKIPVFPDFWKHGERLEVTIEPGVVGMSVVKGAEQHDLPTLLPGVTGPGTYRRIGNRLELDDRTYYGISSEM